MAPEEFVCELKTRLLMDHYAQDNWCPACDCILDKKGRHAQLCASSGDRTRRHNSIRNRFCPFMEAAHLHPELEKPGLLMPSPDQPGADRRRPADVYVPSWQHGAPAAFDFAITSPARQDIVVAAAESNAAARAYEQAKRLYLNTADDCQRQGINFIPMVGEPSGGWGPSAMWVFKTVSKAIANTCGVDAMTVQREHRQALGILLRQANARAIFRRDPGANAPRVDHLTSAAAALDSIDSVD